MIQFLLIVALNFQTSDGVMKNISDAMKAGNAKELVKYFNETVELKIDGGSANYSKNQSEVVLRKFFQKNPTRGFFYVHNGSSAEGLRYAIGQYSTDSGEYRMVLFLKPNEGSYVIDTLRITKESDTNSGE